MRNNEHVTQQKPMLRHRMQGCQQNNKKNEVACLADLYSDLFCHVSLGVAVVLCAHLIASTDLDCLLVSRALMASSFIAYMWLPFDITIELVCFLSLLHNLGHRCMLAVSRARTL